MPLSSFQNFPDPAFDDLNLTTGSQTPFISLDFGEIQTRKQANLDRSINVFHRHILDHEDGGMMAKIQVNPN